MTRYPGVALLLAFWWCAAAAQSPLPTQTMLAERASRRFPQPVRVGELIGRKVLQPEEAQPVLGRVEALERRTGGNVAVVIRAGAVLGLGGRTVAVPLEAVALLGEHVALVDYSPAQLAALPPVEPGTPLPAAETVKVGLAKPFH